MTGEFLQKAHLEALRRAPIIAGYAEYERQLEMLTNILVAAELAKTVMDKEAYIRGCEGAWATVTALDIK